MTSPTSTITGVSGGFRIQGPYTGQPVYFVGKMEQAEAIAQALAEMTE